jgi:hypothetical protein
MGKVVARLRCRTLPQYIFENLTAHCNSVRYSGHQNSNFYLLGCTVFDASLHLPPHVTRTTPLVRQSFSSLFFTVTISSRRPSLAYL